MQACYEYTFSLTYNDIVTGARLLRRKITASNDLEAFTIWCRIPRVNNITMSEVIKLEITHTEKF